MTPDSTPHEYPTVKDAERDIEDRLSEYSTHDEWLPSALPAAVIPSWTEALTAFAVNCTVTQSDELALHQIRSIYRAVEDEFGRRAVELGSGTMATLEPSHVLFIVLFRNLQRMHANKANMNPHKLHVLLDGKYSVA